MRKFIVLFFISASPLALGEEHILQKKETLSGVLFSKGYSPIYGPRGALKELIKLNKITEENRIYPGMTIILPNKKIESSLKEAPLEKKDLRTDSFKRKSFIGFDLYLISATLETLDKFGGKSSLSSKIGLGQGIRLGTSFSEKLGAFVILDQLSLDFVKPEGGETTLGESKTNLFNLSAGLTYSLAPRLSINSSLSLGESVIIRSSDGLNFNVDKLRTERIGVGGTFDIIQRDSWKVYTRGNILLILPTKDGNLSSNQSQAYQAGLGLKKDFSKSFLWLEGLYKKTDLGTNTSDFIQEDIGIAAGIVLNFDN